jgi:N-methylhydantoinase B/oxoprolinase/acetone carboxylase alpha subunit
MKKMNKMYEAPKAEMIEMQMPVVLAQTNVGSGTSGSGFSFFT